MAKDWTTTTWDFGKGRLNITGGTRIWGPWPSPKENCQVWEASLAPHETRKVTLQFLDVPDRAAGVALQSPLDWQVFQRRTKKAGEVPVRCTAPAGCDAVEAQRRVGRRPAARPLAAALPRREPPRLQRHAAGAGRRLVQA